MPLIAAEISVCQIVQAWDTRISPKSVPAVEAHLNYLASMVQFELSPTALPGFEIVL